MEKQTKPIPLDKLQMIKQIASELKAKSKEVEDLILSIIKENKIKEINP